MALQMIHGNQRFPTGICKSLCRFYAYKKRTDQPRTVGDGDPVYLPDPHACLKKSFIHRGDNRRGMPARSNFRNNTVILPMERILTRDNRRQDQPCIVYNSCSRVVAGRLNPQYCLLYTSDAADDLLCVDLGGRRIIKKKKKKK